MKTDLEELVVDNKGKNETDDEKEKILSGESALERSPAVDLRSAGEPKEEHIGNEEEHRERGYRVQRPRVHREEPQAHLDVVQCIQRDHEADERRQAAAHCVVRVQERVHRLSHPKQTSIDDVAQFQRVV